MPNGSWESVGPTRISGAMRQIVVAPTDTDRLYAVAANGGIWRLDSVAGYPGIGWKPLADELVAPRFRTLAASPNDSSVLYAANSVKIRKEGDPDERNIDECTSEIYRFRDSGSGWTQVHDAEMGVVHKLVVHPWNPEIVWAATSTGLWRRNQDGRGWAELRDADCLDVALDPDDSSIIYVGVRKQGVFKSFTSGETWSPEPILEYDASEASHHADGEQREIIRIALGRHNKNGVLETPELRTVVVRFGDEVCVSHTAGEPHDQNPNPTGWSRRALTHAPRPGEGLGGGSIHRSDTFPRESNEWCNCIAVDPFNSEHILAGSAWLFWSRDDGITWESPPPGHGDVHSIAFDPETEGVVYNANDGGIFSSVDGGDTWPDMDQSDTERPPEDGPHALNLARGLVTSELRSSAVRDGRAFATIDHTGFILSEDLPASWQFPVPGNSQENARVFACPESSDRYYIINMRNANDPLGIRGRVAQFDFQRTDNPPFVDRPDFQFLFEQVASVPDHGPYNPEDMIHHENLPGPLAVQVGGNAGRRLIAALRNDVYTIAVGNHADGRLEAFGLGGDARLHHIGQTTPSGSWGSWDALDAPDLHRIVVGNHEDGRLAVFGLGEDKRLHYISQTTVNGSWGDWASLGGTGLLQVFVGNNEDGRLEVFALEGDGRLYHKWQTSPNGSWGDWTPLGGSGLRQIFVGNNEDGRLEAFALGGDARLYHKWQTSPNGSWGGWASRGTPDADKDLRQIFVGNNEDGRLEAFALDEDGELHHIWQTTPNGKWGGWASRGTPDADKKLRQIAVGNNEDGRLEAFALDEDGELHHIWQTTPNGQWGDWASLEGTDLRQIVVANNEDGRLEALALGGNARIYHKGQTSVNGKWGDWHSLGQPAARTIVRSLFVGDPASSGPSQIEGEHADPIYAVTFAHEDPDRAFAMTSRGILLERSLSVAGSFTEIAHWDMPQNDRFVSRLVPSAESGRVLYAMSQTAIAVLNAGASELATIYSVTDPRKSLMSLVAHPDRPRTLFLGTNRGVYQSEDGGTTWTSYQEDLPPVPVTELTFDQGHLYASTYGRGLWRCEPG